MNIQNAQGLFRTVEERLNFGKGNASSQKDASLYQVKVAETAAGNSSNISGEKDLMQVVYPPFFPIGSTQNILSIERVKQLIGENIKSESPETSEEQKAIKQQENSKAASPGTNEMKAKASQVKHDVNRGVVLDITV